jgi:hypothetical protein
MEPTSQFESLCDAKGAAPPPTKDCKYSVRLRRLSGMVES